MSVYMDDEHEVELKKEIEEYDKNTREAIEEAKFNAKYRRQSADNVFQKVMLTIVSCGIVIMVILMIIG